jgi:hypothetical protein
MLSAFKKEHPAFQNIKFLYFYFVGHFCPLGAGPGSADLIERNTDSNRGRFVHINGFDMNNVGHELEFYLAAFFVKMIYLYLIWFMK